MKNCEIYEIELSSLLDGEAAPELAAEAVEHALGCEACAEFFRAARRLNASARQLAGSEPVLSAAHADGLWREIGLRVRRSVESDAFGGPGGVWMRRLRAAALVVLGLGGGYLMADIGGAGAGGAIGDEPVTLAAVPPAQSSMNERRFVALADELLTSDVRYQRAMLEVLRLVPALETGEGLSLNDESSPFVRASTQNEARGTGLL